MFFETSIDIPSQKFKNIGFDFCAQFEQDLSFWCNNVNVNLDSVLHLSILTFNWLDDWLIDWFIDSLFDHFFKNRKAFMQVLLTACWCELGIVQ